MANTSIVQQLTCRLACSGARLSVPVELLVKPEIEGHTRSNVPCFSFLIEHPCGRKLLFDIGLRKDWENLAPVVRHLIESHHITVTAEKDVAEILQENGVDVQGGVIEAVIWSHHHFDHIGNIDTFPSSTRIIVGPGFKDTYLPGYPANPDAALQESDYTGRELQEVSFADGLRLGSCQAFDFFGDGSFYILDTPGHTVGHIGALARVTTTGKGSEQDTFLLLAGDAAHLGSEFRPTQYLPLPRNVDLPASSSWPQGLCPGEVLLKVHPKASPCTPFYDTADGLVVDRAKQDQTIANIGEFDAADNVFLILAHDDQLEDVGPEWFPGYLNDWKKKDLAVKARWKFLSDFGLAAKNVS